MATTTYGTTTTTTRSNSAIYWGIGIALILAIITFFALRDRPVNEMAPVAPMESAPSTTTDVQGAGSVERSTTTESQTVTPSTTTTPAPEESTTPATTAE